MLIHGGFDSFNNQHAESALKLETEVFKHLAADGKPITLISVMVNALTVGVTVEARLRLVSNFADGDSSAS